MSVDQIVFGLLTLLGSGGFALIIVKLMERQKTQAESTKIHADAVVSEAQATDILTRAGTEVVDMLGEQLKQAIARITVLEQQNMTKDGRILELEREVNELRIHVARLESST